MSIRQVIVEDHPEAGEPAREPDSDPEAGAWPVVATIDAEEDVLSKLSVEGATGKPVPPEEAPPPAELRPTRRWLPGVLAVGGAAAVLVGVAWYLHWAAGRSASLPGTLSIETRPAGVIVTVDGKVYGTSPLSVPLPPGPHAVELAGVTKRELSVTIEAGARLAQYVEMPEAPQLGRLHIDTSPPGAQVTVDGTPRGTAPLDIDGLEPGAHVVVLRNGAATVTQNVTVTAGAPVSLVVPLAAAESVQAGFVAVASPVELQIFEGARLIGTSRSDQIMMTAGRHDLRLVNKEVGYDVVRPVQVAPGRLSPLKVDLPNGALFVNAIPWAEVFIDGTKIGETPIANHMLPLGSHEILLRNPRFAEQRRTVVISLTAPVRIGVDLRQ